MRNLFWVLAVLALGLAAAPNAMALPVDTFTFNVDFCTNPCLGGVPASNNGGTVQVTQFAPNILDVTVTLSSGLHFHDQGLDSFAFNIQGQVNLTQVDSLTASGQLAIINGGGGTWTLTRGANNTDGAGSIFVYSLDCAAGAGTCAGSPSTLEFRIELDGQGPFFNPSFLETRTGLAATHTNVDFAANVANGTCTGMIGAGNENEQSTALTTGTGTACARTTVPEPGTLMLVGSGLLSFGLGAFGRRTWMARRRAVA